MVTLWPGMAGGTTVSNMKSNCCGARITILNYTHQTGLCADCHEWCESEIECTLSPDCPCDNCQSQAEGEYILNNY